LRLALCFILVVFFFSCDDSSHDAIPNIAFYHWKNEINLTTSEINYLQSLVVKKLYLRFFDVDWDNEYQEPVPLSVLTISKTQNLPSIIIPTVFITNRTFLKIKNIDIEKFTERVLLKTNTIHKEFPNAQIPEIQIDCDWSGKSRENYFSFLNILRERHLDVLQRRRLAKMGYSKFYFG